jgi:hypothetical protein
MPPQKTSFKLNKNLTIILAVSIILIAGAYWIGNTSGYDSGYSQAQTDAVSLQDESSRKAIEDAAKSANPFQAVNPLEGVEANPFDKVKKILNPFEE